MSESSPVSTAFHEAYEAEFLPLLKAVGLAPEKFPDTKPGLVLAYATRRLDGERRFAMTLWCDGGSGTNFRLRFDVVEPIRGKGIEGSREIELTTPWIDSSDPRGRRVGLSSVFTSEFRPHESAEQLKTTIAFVAGAFAASAEQLAAAVPELADSLRASTASPAWQAAAARAEKLWKTRHLRGDIEERSVAAIVVFVGENLLTVEAEGVRQTFRFPTQSFDRGLPTSVSGWCKSAAGTKVPTRLSNGDASWTFDLRGTLVSASPHAS